jgi:hypothetical protein
VNWYSPTVRVGFAGITQGIAGRIRDGTAANAKAIESAKCTVPLSKASGEYAQKAGAVCRSNARAGVVLTFPWRAGLSCLA